MERVLEHSVLGRGRRRRAGRRERYVAAEDAEEAEEERLEQLIGAREAAGGGEEGDEEQVELECGAPLIAVPALDRRLASLAHAKRLPLRTRAVCTIFGLLFERSNPFDRSNLAPASSSNALVECCTS